MFRKCTMSLFLCLLVFAGSLSAGATATVEGSVISRSDTTGPAGGLNTITLILDTHDGGYWGVQCRLADSNLGLCLNIHQYDSIIASGVLYPSPGYAGCGSVRPTQLTKTN